MNQVKLPKTFYPNPLKKGTDTRVETVVREVLCNNYQSRNLIGPYHSLGISPRIRLPLPDCFLPGGAHGLGMRLLVLSIGNS